MATIPEGNLGLVTNQNTTPRKNMNALTCHDCESEYQFRGHPDFSKRKSPQDTTGKITSIGNTGGTKDTVKSSGDWKFIHPSDNNSIFTVNNIKYYFCKYCTCIHTGPQGFFNCIHFTRDHNFRKAKPSGDYATVATDTSTLFGGYSISSLGSRSATPEGNLTAISKVKLLPPIK